VAVHRRGGAAIDEQPGCVARLDRYLGDQRRVEVVVEVLEAHRRQATVAAVTDSRTEAVAVAGGTMNLEVWLPPRGSGPGLLLIPEIFGIARYIRSVADRLTLAGYVVAAPEIFWRIAPGWERPADEAGTAESLALVGQLDFPAAVADCTSALAALDALPEVDGPTGVLGFCLGGTLAFAVAAAGDPAVCVSYYGSRVPAMLDQLDAVSCPTLFHFGSRDPYIPGEGVDALASAIAERSHLLLNVEIAGHAFDNDAPMFHDEAAARAAWSKTMAFLAEHLPSAAAASP
jgi:carboxymethylenebutenolidase